MAWGGCPSLLLLCSEPEAGGWGLAGSGAEVLQRFSYITYLMALPSRSLSYSVYVFHWEAPSYVSHTQLFLDL